VFVREEMRKTSPDQADREKRTYEVTEDFFGWSGKAEGTSGVRSSPQQPIFLAYDCLQNIGNTSDILILKSKSVSDFKLRHRNLLIILLLQRVNFIKCGEYSFGQKT
jgi:hypothetical protein